MATEGRNRWFHDGWNARLNGKPRNSNPRRSPQQKWTGVVRNVKWSRWDDGWEAADTQLRGMTAWDRDQDVINELFRALAGDATKD